MSGPVLLDLSVSDVHAPGAMSGYAAGYSQGAPEKQHAALAVVRNRKGHVLTVSRPEPPYEQAIPGGLVEPGEAHDVAAMRELKEECGVICTGLRHLCDTVSPTDGRPVHVYTAAAFSGEPVAAEPNTRVAWLHPDHLMRQATVYGPTVKTIKAAGGIEMPKTVGANMADITTKKRNALPDQSFALPASRKYPIHDRNHTANAAARLAQAKKVGKVSDADYATASAAIAKAEKKFGIKPSPDTGATDKPRPRMHHFQIAADLAPGGSLHVKHAAMSDAGGVAFMPPMPVKS